MSTALTGFIDDIRVLLGDSDPDIEFREDAQYVAAMRATINLGKVVGDQTSVAKYAVDSTGDYITPDLTPASDSKAYCQLIYHSAKLFAVDITPTHWHTRAFSETVGENKERVFSLMQSIYETDNGTGCGGSDYE